MTFEKSFCSSPWFHMRITNSGTYEYCRWMNKSAPTRVNFNHSIQTESPKIYFQQTMAPIRKELLNGFAVSGCKDCLIMEQHGKVSGRQRQLLKVGVMTEHFEPSMASSPLLSDFDYSVDNDGHTLRTVTDWQIDLGNYCNGACIFCNPESSSRLAAEFKQLGLTDTVPPPAWCDDPILLQQFIEDLKSSDNLQYLHFLGGETIITPGFKKILLALVEADLARGITIGFTTNLTVWSDSVVDLLKKFKQVNLGMSVETLTRVNDYVRYPSELEKTCQLLDRWRILGEQQQWLIQLRITPTCLTVHDLSTVYEYAWQHHIAVESCNFLENPAFLRIGVLPLPQRQAACTRLANWLADHLVTEQDQIVNTRDPNQARAQIYQDAQSYLNYLTTAPDESTKLPALITYLKQLEVSRNNNILTYIPEYEELFRSAGY